MILAIDAPNRLNQLAEISSFNFLSNCYQAMTSFNKEHISMFNKGIKKDQFRYVDSFIVMY